MRTGWMALSLLPQPKTVKTLVGFFDFKEVDTIYISKRASARVKRTATLLAAELYRHHPWITRCKPLPMWTTRMVV